MLENIWNLALTWPDLVRYGLAWLVCTALVVFWYWVMSRIGTF
ncbi:hypothetical protein [Actinomadura rugatobispora]|uniref:Uncharacterized protein n=1 Tax=Actinomadura rugatobispora TaxID=1994 RepID=A0ABW1A0J2_9ACTN|nr:hypothetical protein GCM10010200_100450 [Actinomadura rugatobispora]